jgi:hypothetical protein
MSTHPPDFQHAVALFNQQAFFECHEVLEDLWRPLPAGPEKEFLQGLLQVGVGFHHLNNGNYTGAKNLLTAGVEKLEAVASQRAYQPPIPLTSLLTTSQQALAQLLQLGPERLHEFPASLIPTILPSRDIP